MNRGRRWVTLLGLILLACGVFGTGIHWGLPSSTADFFLFGDHAVWSGERMIALQGPDRPDRNRAADVDRDPVAFTQSAVVLNATDEQRAQIVRRYRLFSDQPDEMTTMMALAQMHPGRGDLDPRMYKYGGAWVYPVGAMLRAAAAVGYIQPLVNDLAFYLDHPEVFGRFYVVARLYTLFWAVVGVWAVFRLAEFFARGLLIPAAAAICYIFLPVVVNMAHEAKPHLPGSVLMLLAIIAAIRFVQTGKARWCIWTGLACGAAVGMVPSSVPVFVVIPMMAIIRGQKWGERLRICMAAGILGVLVYLLTNPYVPINLIYNRALLKSHFSNTSVMYHASGAGLVRALRLMMDGTGLVAGIFGAAGVVVFVLTGHKRRQHPDAVHPDAVEGSFVAGWMLGLPALLVAVQFALVADGLPGEFGRFFVLPDVVLMITALVAIVKMTPNAGLRLVSLVIVIAGGVLFGSNYLRGFVRDSRLVTSRMLYAEQLHELQAAGLQTMGIYADPAPYCLPPVDLFAWQLIRLPAGGEAIAQPDVLVRAVDFPQPPPPGYRRVPSISSHYILPTPISWADKPMDIFVRE